MRKVVLMIGAIVLISIATYVAAQDSAVASAPPASTRLAVAETSEAAFRKLDTDRDGRISALEANENPKLAALFVMADRDKDGFLSKEEFAALSTAPMHTETDAQTPSGDRVSVPAGDQTATAPNELQPATAPNETSATDNSTDTPPAPHVKLVRPH